MLLQKRKKFRTKIQLQMTLSLAAYK